MNRLLLYGAIAFAALLFIAKPWDSGESAKEKMISDIDEGMVTLGVPAATRECVTEGFEREFTDADAELATEVSDGGFSAQRAMADPAMRAVAIKMTTVMGACPGVVESVRQGALAALSG